LPLDNKQVLTTARTFTIVYSFMYTINNLTANEREKYNENKENKKRERGEKIINYNHFN